MKKKERENFILYVRILYWVKLFSVTFLWVSFSYLYVEDNHTYDTFSLLLSIFFFYNDFLLYDTTFYTASVRLTYVKWKFSYLVRFDEGVTYVHTCIRSAHSILFSFLFRWGSVRDNVARTSAWVLNRNYSLYPHVLNCYCCWCLYFIVY